MKYIFCLLIFLSFVANAQRLKGLDFNQKWKCMVKKVYSRPLNFNPKETRLRPGDLLLIDQKINPQRKNLYPSINDLIEDIGFTVGEYRMWHYSPFKRGGQKFEKFCQRPCLIYTTKKLGRWVFYPIKKGRMGAFYDIARYPDLNMGERTLEFYCIKAESR